MGYYDQILGTFLQEYKNVLGDSVSSYIRILEETNCRKETLGVAFAALAHVSVQSLDIIDDIKVPKCKADIENNDEQNLKYTMARDCKRTDQSLESNSVVMYSLNLYSRYDCKEDGNSKFQDIPDAMIYAVLHHFSFQNLSLIKSNIDSRISKAINEMITRASMQLEMDLLSENDFNAIHNTKQHISSITS